MDPIKDAIQKVLDTHGDGWAVAQFVVGMGLERIVDDQVEAVPWIYAPMGQPDWMTEKLIEMAEVLHHDTIDEELD